MMQKGLVTLLYKSTGRGDACVAPAGLSRSTASTACLWAGLIVCVRGNRRILVGAMQTPPFLVSISDFLPPPTPVVEASP